MKPRVSIIGGGAIGLSIAWELARRNYQVTLLERNRIGRATSWAATGILPPANLETATDPIDQLRGLSHLLYPEWVQALESATSIDCGFQKCGGWYLADSAGERAAMTGMTGYWDELCIKCEQIAAQELAHREPALRQWAERSANRAAWWVPDEYQVRPPRFLRALEKACRTLGVDILEHSPVSDIRTTDQYAELLVNENWLRSDSAVVCGGAWTGGIADALQLRSSIVPIRGQLLLLKTATPLLRAVVNLGHRYIVCRDDGNTLIGSCEEEAGFELGTTDSILHALRDFAISLVPELETADQVDAWSGLRPMSFSGFPIIGRVPATKNLYVAAGHYRSGVHLSPGTAVTIADLLEGAKPQISLDSFRVGNQSTAT